MRFSWSVLLGFILYFVCESFMVVFCKNGPVLFLCIPLCSGTPDDPAVAPVEAGHCEEGRGGVKGEEGIEGAK